MFAKIRAFFRTYPYALLGLYPIFHILAFFLLGIYSPVRYVVESKLDALIPFCEWFIIPYYLWYPYLFLGMVAFLFVSRKDFLRMAVCTIGGMAVCITICIAFPTAIAFRPTSFDRSNPLIWLVEFTYAVDQPWNVFPSMHCFGAIGITIAVWKSEILCKLKWMRPASGILCILICMATVFVKQHSVLDFFGAVVLALLFYPLAYCVRWKFLQGNDVADLAADFYRKSLKQDKKQTLSEPLQ